MGPVPSDIRGLCRQFVIITAPPTNASVGWFTEQYMAKYHPHACALPLQLIIKTAIANDDVIAYVNAHACLPHCDMLGDEVVWMALCRSDDIFCMVMPSPSLEEVMQVCGQRRVTGNELQVLRYAIISGKVSITHPLLAYSVDGGLCDIEGSIVRGEDTNIIIEKMRAVGSRGMTDVYRLCKRHNRMDVLHSMCFPAPNDLCKGDGELPYMEVKYHVPSFHLGMLKQGRVLTGQQIITIMVWALDNADVDTLTWILPRYPGTIRIEDTVNSTRYYGHTNTIITFLPVLSVRRVLEKYATISL